MTWNELPRAEASVAVRDQVDVRDAVQLPIAVEIRQPEEAQLDNRIRRSLAERLYTSSYGGEPSKRVFRLRLPNGRPLFRGIVAGCKPLFKSASASRLSIAASRRLRSSRSVCSKHKSSTMLALSSRAGRT